MKKIVYILVVIVCLFVINSILRSIIDIWQKQDLLIATKKELAQVKEQNAKLKKKEKQVQDPIFFEEQARDKLFFVKSDERLVLMARSIASSDAGSTVQVVVKTPIYIQWIDLFVKGRVQ